MIIAAFPWPIPAGPDLYCLTDSAGGDFEAQTRLLIAGGARIVQLRAKELGDADFLRVAQRMREMTAAAGVCFVVNDRLEAALACGADALHLGQDDLPVAEAVQRAGGRLRVGISTHNAAQLEAALAGPADYIAVGPVFGTRSKANPDPATGVELLAEAARRAGSRPVVAIGGIGESNMAAVQAAAPRALVAVISAVWSAQDPAAAVRTLRRRLGAA